MMKVITWMYMEVRGRVNCLKWNAPRFNLVVIMPAEASWNNRLFRGSP